MDKALVFIVEDDLHIQQLVKYNLESAGFLTKTFENGESMLKDCSSTLPDLFLLDIMLPGIDGIEICKRLKLTEITKDLPVIFLTAKSEELERILGLEIGADDYIVKPFSVRELIARVKAVLRRSTKDDSEYEMSILRYGPLLLDEIRREVKKAGKIVDMSLKEFELLKILMFNKGKVLSREFLLENVWGYEFGGETRTVDVHIRYLRQKIEDDDSNPVFVETVRGVGYKFNDRA